MSHIQHNWDRGQGLVEYALILVLVAIVVLVALGAMGVAINEQMYENIVEAVNSIP